MIKIKFNENNPSIIFLYLKSLEGYIKIINSIVIIKLRIDIHIIFYQLHFNYGKVYIEKKEKEYYGINHITLSILIAILN